MPNPDGYPFISWRSSRAAQRNEFVQHRMLEEAASNHLNVVICFPSEEAAQEGYRQYVWYLQRVASLFRATCHDPTRIIRFEGGGQLSFVSAAARQELRPPLPTTPPEDDVPIRQEYRCVWEEIAPSSPGAALRALAQLNGAAWDGLFGIDEGQTTPNGVEHRRHQRFRELRAAGKRLGEINQILAAEGFSEVSGEGVMPCPTTHHAIIREGKGARRMIEKGPLLDA